MPALEFQLTVQQGDMPPLTRRFGIVPARTMGALIGLCPLPGYIQAALDKLRRREAQRVWDMRLAMDLGELAGIPPGLTLQQAEALLPQLRPEACDA